MQEFDKVNPDILDLREKEDRRFFGPSPQFPVFDDESNLVIKDRRFIPDRRIANIQVRGHFLNIKRGY